MSKNHLFSLTITPVQSFISQAKTTRDFYSGSQIISNLIQELLKCFPNSEDIIFPATDDIVSNKIIARINIEKQENLVKNFKRITDTFLSSYALKNDITKFGNDGAKVFQLFYTSTKIDDDYRSSYLEVEKNLLPLKT